jgi:hypothetical protein
MKETASNMTYLLRVGLFVIAATVEGVSRTLAAAGSKIRNVICPAQRGTSNWPGEFGHDSTHFEKRA